VGEIISNTDSLLRLIDATCTDNLGAAFDTGHQHAQKEILPLSIEKLGTRVFYVHVSDNDGRTNEHLPLGGGTINWRSFFATLKKHAYDGFVAVDVGAVNDLDEAYRSSLAFLEQIGEEMDM
jgi:sugar phosphate isomerase/epimerase